MKHKDKLDLLMREHEELNQVFKPVFYRLSDPADEKKFSELLVKPGLIVADHLLEQVKDLVKFKNPSKLYSPAELESDALACIGSDSSKYGTWVYYPWANRLVHTLDRQDFIDVRTSRNQNKITRHERDILGQKKIGVIGLSVGQSVSVTLAMERVCGEIRLADFDVLELTNLNRIRTGIHNLGLPKVYSVAREISEIDPYIDVICFPEGLTEANMDKFFLEGGKLDLLVEESDGFDIKILSRYKARELQVPVIMEASDRCAVDVERFDLHPDRSILHGLVDHLDLATLKSLKTNDEKIPYMIEMLGLETSSLKLKASMLEIGQTINTWPQLASAVTMGGGITADISRRMLLNQYTQSGRFHVDIEELIGEPRQPGAETKKASAALPAAKDLLDNIAPALQKDQQELSRADAEKLAAAGSQAPSEGNLQPWRWVYNNGTLQLFNALPGNATLDYDHLSSYTSLGAAAENIVLQAGAMGLEAKPAFFPDAAAGKPVVSFSFFRSAAADKIQQARASAIFNRCTNRKLGQRQSIEQSLLDRLISSARETQGADLHFLTGAEELNAIGNLLGEIEKIRLLEKEGHHDLVNELRWTREEAEAKRDGLDLRGFDYTNTERMTLQVARHWPVMELINKWNGGNVIRNMARKPIDAAGAVGVITMNSNTRLSRLLGGMAAERVWLDATQAGLAFHPLNTAVFLYNRVLKGAGEQLSQQGSQKLMELRPAFEKTLLIQKDCIEIFIFRLSKAGEPGIRSLRKPLEEVFYYK